MVKVNPNLAYNYDHTVLITHYKYVHNALKMDALSKVFPFIPLKIFYSFKFNVKIKVLLEK